MLMEHQKHQSINQWAIASIVLPRGYFHFQLGFYWPGQTVQNVNLYFHPLDQTLSACLHHPIPAEVHGYINLHLCLDDWDVGQY
uniref:Uncharacterized protein n=1 Tax=Arundo donax TaxID=35708 RepID=A0A0A9DBH2_ARUDO